MNKVRVEHVTRIKVEMSTLTEVSSSKSFAGLQKVFTHQSKVCNCLMTFTIYVPPAASLQGHRVQVPVLYYLAGLGSDPEGFITTSGLQRDASEHNLVILSPDTSPRNTGIEGECSENRFVGHGAGFYLDATAETWRGHYRMFSYVTKELIELVEANFAFVLPGRRGIVGHSIGGHGSLICGLRRPDLYMSLSTLAPVCNLSEFDKDIPNGPLMNYLGPDTETWKEWDASELSKVHKGRRLHIKMDIGSCDSHWEQLRPWSLVRALGGNPNVSLELNVRAGYEHNSFSGSIVIGEHMKYHANILHANL